MLGKFLVENNFINDDYGKRLTVKLNLQGVFKRELKSVEKVGETTQYVRNYNDFIFGKQNVHKGCFGIIPKELDGYVSSSDIPSFSCNERLHPYFLFYNFSRSKFYKSLENKMTGTGSKRLQVQTFLNLSILIPNSIDEQIKISKFFSLLDKHIELWERKLQLYLLKKKHYLNSMFSNHSSLPFLRFKGFDDEWKLNKIKDILNYTQPNKYIEDNFDNYYNLESKIPVLTPGKSFILGYTNNIENSFNDESILIDDFTLSMQYTTFPYKVKSSACKILTPKENVNLYFVFNVLTRQNLKPLGHNRHYISFLENKKIYLPNINEQVKISKFLSLLDNNIKLSQENIDNLKIKKLFYINKMFI